MSLIKQNLKPKNFRERGINLLLLSSALLTIMTTLGIIAVLFFDSFVFFHHVSPVQFLFGKAWNPTILPFRYGILPLISGTLYFTFLTALIAIPTGLFTAVFLSEYASPKLRSLLKPGLELLAGLPTVVYGYFALVYLTPILRNIFPAIQTFNVLSAAIVVAVMIIPTIASISEDALRSVPMSLRNASYGLGAAKYQTCIRVVIPSGISGVVSSFMLGISRAIGETMAVTIAAGNLARIIQPFKLKDSLLGPVQTMTAAMVEIGISDVSGHSIAYKSLFAVGLILFLMTFLMNVLSQYFKMKYREVYE